MPKISVGEYEKILEAMNKIHQEIKERLKTPKEDYINGKDVIERYILDKGLRPIEAIGVQKLL